MESDLLPEALNVDKNKLLALIAEIKAKAEINGNLHLLNEGLLGEISYAREIMWRLQELGIIPDDGESPFSVKRG